jgi:hypothetical protein
MVLQNTIEEQRARANVVGKMPVRMIFQGLNLKRLVIATWPKLTQQAVGLSVFNNYSTYFCKSTSRVRRDLLKLMHQSNLPDSPTPSSSASFSPVVRSSR